MSDTQDTPDVDPAVLLLAVEAIGQRAMEVAAELRNRVTQDMRQGDRSSVVIDMPDGTELDLGTITRTKPKPKPDTRQVVDRTAFLAWVKVHHPEEVVVEESVRASYEAAVMADGGLDLGTGELLDLPPGVQWVTPRPTASTLQVRKVDDVAELLRAAVAAGALDLRPALAELEP